MNKVYILFVSNLIKMPYKYDRFASKCREITPERSLDILLTRSDFFPDYFYREVLSKFPKISWKSDIGLHTVFYCIQ